MIGADKVATAPLGITKVLEARGVHPRPVVTVGPRPRYRGCSQRKVAPRRVHGGQADAEPAAGLRSPPTHGVRRNYKRTTHATAPCEDCDVAHGLGGRRIADRLSVAPLGSHPGYLPFLRVNLAPRKGYHFPSIDIALFSGPSGGRIRPATPANLRRLRQLEGSATGPFRRHHPGVGSARDDAPPTAFR